MCDLTFISRVIDGLVLVETWDEIGPSMQPFKTQAKLILKKLDRAPKRMSIDSKVHVFHYIIENGISYMTLCDRTYPKKLAFSFLEELHKLFNEELTREFGQVPQGDFRPYVERIEKPYYFIKFDRIIQRKKGEYKDPRSSKALAKLNENLTEVTTIMRQNIDEILQRG
eukprot:Platyproteum_vivax@DN5112_c0_g1_i1.p1